MVNSKSMMDIKAGDSGVMIVYQVDEFTCMWLAKHFIAQSHICCGFMVKVFT